MPDLAEPELELLDHRQDRLAARGAGVLHRLDGFAAEPRRHGHQTREQPLFVERDVAGRADGRDIDGRRFGADLGIGLVDRREDDLGHGHGKELAEFALVVRGDIDGFHGHGSSCSTRVGSFQFSGIRASRACPRIEVGLSFIRSCVSSSLRRARPSRPFRRRFAGARSLL